MMLGFSVCCVFVLAAYYGIMRMVSTDVLGLDTRTPHTAAASAKPRADRSKCRVASVEARQQAHHQLTDVPAVWAAAMSAKFEAVCEAA